MGDPCTGVASVMIVFSGFVASAMVMAVFFELSEKDPVEKSVAQWRAVRSIVERRRRPKK